MEGNTEEQDLYNQSFIDVPAILDKHKAAAEVCQGKYQFPIPNTNNSRDLDH